MLRFVKKLSFTAALPNKKLFSNKKVKPLVALLLLFCVILFFRSDYTPDLYFISVFSLSRNDDVSCHYSSDNDVLLPAEGTWFKPPGRSIFFHETSCRGDLTVRQMCSVESASRAHPLWSINVLFSGPVNGITYLSGKMATLHSLDNVNFARVHLLEYAKNTPLEALVSGGALNNSRWRYFHSSDVLRYLTLYKWGGIYLDLDLIVVKPLTALARNWAARETDYGVASGALAFRRDGLGRLVAMNALQDLKGNYRGDRWGHNGPGTITRVLKKICDTTIVSKMSSVSCQGFEVYHPKFFYRIYWQNSSVYFKKGNLSTPDAYVHHTANSQAASLKVENGSPYQNLASKHCPTTYDAFPHDFGL